MVNYMHFSLSLRAEVGTIPNIIMLSRDESYYSRYRVFMATIIQMTALRDRRFKGAYGFHHHDVYVIKQSHTVVLNLVYVWSDLIKRRGDGSSNHL
jgi:hypothetical protein